MLLAFLIPNMVRMWWFTIGRETTGRSRTLRLSATAYLKSVYQFPLHFITQKRYAQCERKRPWAIHLALMLSYVTMLVLIMFFLKYMWAGPKIDWRVHVFGYLASAGLIVATAWAIIGRLKKLEAQHQHSHESDWIFLILLLVVALTGVLQHVLHRAGVDRGGQRLVRCPPHGSGPHAGPGSAVQQVVAHGLPAAGHVLLGAAQADGAGPGA